MKKIAVLSVLVALALLFASTPSSQQQSPGTLYVNNTDPTCQGRSPCFTTIQAAVNAALSGETIQIQAGTYPEKVTVSGKNNTATAMESDRIIIEADPDAAIGSVVVTGATQVCTLGYAFRLQQSKFITIRGLTITGTGGQAIELMGGNNQNQAVHIERNRIFGNGSSECNGGITIARGNPDTFIVNNLIYANGRNGIATIDADGGPHNIIENTIHANQWSGVRVTRSHQALLANNLITQNGTATGSTGGRFGVSREGSTSPQPQEIQLLNNVICGNRLGEIDGPALDATDSGNLTPVGNEGPGVSASPGCEIPANVYANLNGPDGLPNTIDDDFSLASASPAIDKGIDPRTLGLSALFNPIFEADFLTDLIRPQIGIRGGSAIFDIGAFEYAIPNQAPVTNAGADRTVASGTLVNLDGSASFDPDGDPITYQWTQTGGPSVSLSGPTSVNPTFTAPQVQAPTVLTFQLTVTDGLATSVATVRITVEKPNSPPVLSPIGNKTVSVANTLTFTVNATDPDNDPLTYSVSPLPLPANASFDTNTRVFNLTPAADQVGSFNLTFAVSDGRGGTASETLKITVLAGLAVSITSPANGATVPSGRLVVRGTATTGPDIGVNVKGFAASLNGGQWVVEIPLDPGPQTLTAKATTVAGLQATHSVTVNVAATGGGGLLLSASPRSGVGPLTVSWLFSNQTGRTLSQFEFDDNGSGVFGAPMSSFDGMQTTYMTPGIYSPALRAQDDQGITYTATAVIEVEDPTVVTARFQGLWTTLRDRLISGDIQGALNHFAPGVRSRFESVFERLGANLPSIAAGFGNLEVLEQLENIAETIIVQQENNSARLYFIYYRRDSLGRWLIEEM